MAYDIGPKIGIDGEAEFRRAIQNINTNIKTLGTEMLAVTSAYDANDKSAQALAARNEVLVKQIDAQREKLAKLQEGLDASRDKYGDADEKTQRWQQTVNKATADLNQMERQLQQNTRELEGNTGEVRENTGELKNQGSALDGLKDKLKTVGSGLATAAKAAAAAVAAASTAVAAFAKSSIDAGMSFDSSMSQVAATMGKTTDEISELRDFALQMGSSTAFSASQAADALNYMALAGYSAEESMQALPNVLNLAAAGGIELATASDMVTDAQSALGLSMEESAELVDMMAKASSKSNTSVAQLGEAILTIGGTAKNLAGGTTELNTVLGILADNNIKGAEGGTALRNMLNSLTAPTKDAAKLLDGLGVSVFDAEGNLRSLNDIFLDLRNSTESMAQEDRMNVVSTIFNARDMKSAEALLANVGDRYEELSGYIANAAGAAEQMANTQLDNLAGDITFLQSALEGAQIALSDQLTPALREFVSFGTESLSELTAAFQENGLEGAMSVLPDVLSDGIAKLSEVIPQFLEAGIQLLGAIGDGIMQSAPAILTALYDGIMTGLPVLAESAAQIMGNLGQYLQENMPVLLEAGLTALAELTGSIRENAGIIVDGAIELAKSLAQGLADSIPTIIENVPTIVSNIANTINDNAPKILKAGVDIIVTLVKGLIDSIPTIIENMPKIIAAVWDTITAVNWISLGNSIVTGIGSGISGMVQAAQNAIGTIKEALKNGVKTLPDTFKTIGKDVIQGMINGIKGMVSNVVKSAKEVVTSVVSGVKSTLGINSPSKVFAGIGGYMAEGLEQGFGDEMGAVQRSIDRSMAELAGNARGTVRMEAVPANGLEPAGTANSSGTDSIVSALRQALEGMDVYLDGRRVGQLVSGWQNNDNKAWAR